MNTQKITRESAGFLDLSTRVLMSLTPMRVRELTGMKSTAEDYALFEGALYSATSRARILAETETSVARGLGITPTRAEVEAELAQYLTPAQLVEFGYCTVQ